MLKKLLSLPILLIYFALGAIYLNAWISPSECYVLSFIALGYLVIIILFFLSLFVAYRISKPLFVVGLIVFFVGIQFHLSYFSIASPNESKTSNSFKILSYNVRLFNVYEPNGTATSKAEMFDYLREQKADIYCFQEFYQQDAPTKFVTKDSLIKVLKTPNVYEHYSFLYQGRQYFGVVMMTRFPVIERGDVSFEDRTHQDHNYCIYMDIVPKVGDTLRVYNAHLQSIKLNNSDIAGIENETRYSPKNDYKDAFKKLKSAFLKRQKQTEKILEHIQTSPYPVIITGDFNDTPTSYTYQQFRKYLDDAFTENRTGIGATYAGKLPIGRIDYIFHSEGLNAYDFEIQKEKFTDHHAISCKFNY